VSITRSSAFVLGATLSLAACHGQDGLPPAIEVRPEALELVAPDLQFRHVRDIALFDGAAWVLDSDAPHVTEVRMEGASGVGVRFELPPTPHGSEADPRALQVTDRTVEVWDFVADRRVAYDRSSRALKVSALADQDRGAVRPDMAEVSHLDPWRVRRVGPAVVGVDFPRGVSEPMELASGTISLLTRDLAPSATIVTLAEQIPRDARSAGQFPWLPLWEVCGEQIVTWNARSGSVVWWDSLGSAREIIPVPIQTREPSHEQIASFLTAMAVHEGESAPPRASVIDARAREVRPLFDSPTPPFVDISCDSTTGVWLRMFDLDDDPLGRGRTWLRVGRSGPQVRVRFPTDFRPFAFLEDSTLGVLTRPGFDHLAVWRGSPP
jgi:hypothetical protein